MGRQDGSSVGDGLVGDGAGTEERGGSFHGNTSPASSSCSSGQTQLRMFPDRSNRRCTATELRMSSRSVSWRTGVQR